MQQRMHQTCPQAPDDCPRSSPRTALAQGSPFSPHGTLLSLGDSFGLLCVTDLSTSLSLQLCSFHALVPPVTWQGTFSPLALPPWKPHLLPPPFTHPLIIQMFIVPILCLVAVPGTEVITTNKSWPSLQLRVSRRDGEFPMLGNKPQ